MTVGAHQLAFIYFCDDLLIGTANPAHVSDVEHLLSPFFDVIKV
jgi:hypothetical protein